MTVTAASFKKDFPAFNDAARFPDGHVGFWIAVGVIMLNANPARWADLLDFGIELFTAHNLALERSAIDAGQAGGIPGIEPGIIQSEHVDKVAIAYDTTGAAELNAGHWNLTTYGLRFIQLARMIGAGGLQL